MDLLKNISANPLPCQFSIKLMFAANKTNLRTLFLIFNIKNKLYFTKNFVVKLIKLIVDIGNFKDKSKLKEQEKTIK